MIVYVTLIKEWNGIQPGGPQIQILESLAKTLFENGFIEDPFPAAVELKKKLKTKDADAPEI